MPLFCVDIYDTVLTRLVGHPRSLFLLLGRRLQRRGLIAMAPEEFARARAQAEGAARGLHPKGEVRFDEIWQKLGETLSLEASVVKAAAEEELALEDEFTRPIPGARERLLEMRGEGKVAFVSNMYLPASFLMGQLHKYGLAIDGNSPLYLSCDHECSKSNGDLFRSVLSAENTHVSDASHWGNDPVSDIAGARQAGMRATLYSGCELNRYERLLEKSAPDTAGFVSQFSGASRLTRLEASGRDARTRAIWDVAAGVAGPALIGFVCWVFQRARKLGLRRLYFVSRDGQVLLELARSLAGRVGFDFEFRYLYGSRQSWHLPSVTEVTARELAWITDASQALTVESALTRVGLKPEAFASELSEFGFTPGSYKRSLGADRTKLASFLQKPVIVAAIAAQARHYADALVQYLRQEGLFDGVPSGIVDVGWTGRMLDSLHSLLQRSGVAAPYGLYFGLVGQGKAHPDALSPREGFYLDAYRARTEPVALPGRAVLLETFCAGDHGQVHHFEASETSAVPVLRHARNAHVLDWGLPEFRSALASFSKNLVLDTHDLAEVDADRLRLPIGRVLHEFWSNPSREEAEAWGSFPYYDDQAESAWNQLARPYSFRDLAQLPRVARGHSARPDSVNWEAASLALTAEPVRSLIRLAQACAPVYASLRKALSR